MKTREEIYRALKLCSNYEYRCNECPYRDETTQEGCHADELMNDAAKYLKQEEGYWSGDICSKCGKSKYNWFTVVSDKSKPNGHWQYCPGCGARMKENPEWR